MPKLCRSLPQSFSSIQACKVATRGLRLLNFEAMFACKITLQIGVGLTCAKCSCEAVISGSSVQSLQKDSLATETTGGEILVAF